MFLLLLACGASAKKLPTAAIEVGDVEINVELADSPEERHQGLMHRKTLAEDSGMLFVYPSAEPRSFWMENTSVPLSIAFLDETGRILNIEDMKPFDRTSVPSAGDALYALEMNKGWFAAHEIERGAVVSKLPGASEK
ncbi:MAG: DUF192 domain-containing protein [Proteobacteria bacterium]|nr:DUF192 domain-containing protein [Pseudomonadota bacterium]MCP4917579.1 DUF192 domain-containing protein [Pseudomonadota bacterium]